MNESPDPIAALQRAKARQKSSPSSQVKGLQAPIVSIRHGRATGVYITRWWTVQLGEVTEHEETTYGIADLRRLLRDTIRRDDYERIIQATLHPLSQ